MMASDLQTYVLAFDTANEVIAIGVGLLDAAERSISPVACTSIEAHRASNTKLVPSIETLLSDAGVSRADIACVACGRGPGSFTGVRIAMATAKGIASALGVALIGFSTLDAIAWQCWADGIRGDVLVAADAMRKEIYPVRFALADDGPQRLGADRVVKAAAAADELAAESAGSDAAPSASGADLKLTGDALAKYVDLLAPYGELLPERLWTPTGEGLLLAVQAAWRAGAADPFDAKRHNPAFALPVYTRLSDAEETERARLARTEDRDLATGVQGESGLAYLPLDAHFAEAVASLEGDLMGGDAWTPSMVADELVHKNRTWWMCVHRDATGQLEHLIGYAGGLVIDGDVQILKVAVSPAWQRRGIARELLSRVCEDARNLGAQTCSLEVRVSNTGAQAFYEALGLTNIGTRPGYYQDREDAVIMQGPLVHAGSDSASHADDVAGIHLQENALSTGAAVAHPLIFAIESSCDETAAAIIDGNGQLVADVVASQIDFHARFGGVVPEIASRKHIEAICGVCDECLVVAARNLSCTALTWENVDAIAVTYAPGLVGALVVGVAFAKGVAWGAGKPFIGVNHLEGHLYANKLADPNLAPPLVASLVSGGNTMLVHVRDWGSYEVMGSTIDDAVGEAFDKVAKALGLGYPGGPVISRQASMGDPHAIAFPRAMLHSGDLRFSLSGLKTAVITYIKQQRDAEAEALNAGIQPSRSLAEQVPDICASFQQAVIDVQVAKARTALQQTGAGTFCLGGGVAANKALRDAYAAMCAQEGVKLVMAPMSACGDNAGMIALVARDRFEQGKFFGLDADAYAHADLEQPY